VTGSAIVTINTTAKAGARAAVGEPSGLHLQAGDVMLGAAVLLFLAVAHLAVRALWLERRW
jgi:hypothetical protein